ncbi:glycosyltransferase [Opitutales bacterium]|nr:glycosyltransferase [Opitutales bacterium]
MQSIEIIIPVFNDTESLYILLDRINKLESNCYSFSVTIIDDFSYNPVSEQLEIKNYTLIKNISIIRLAKNCGHQVAIATGLREVSKSKPNFIVVIDGDGEDNPNKIIKLLDRSVEENSIIVASRGDRYESILFKSFYFVYILLFKTATGLKINFGNFSVVPAEILPSINALNTTAIHYPATLLKSQLNIIKLKIDREKRYSGKSKMNLTSLINHGLRSFSIYNEQVISRLLILSSSLLILIFASISCIIALKIIGYATPGWASNVALSLLLLASQTFMMAFFSIIILPLLKESHTEVDFTKNKMK